MDLSAVIGAEYSALLIYLFKRIKENLSSHLAFSEDFSSAGQDGPLQWGDEIFIPVCSCLKLRVGPHVRAIIGSSKGTSKPKVNSSCLLMVCFTV